MYIDRARVEPILAGVSSGLIIGTAIKFFLSLILDSSVILWAGIQSAGAPLTNMVEL